MRSSDFGIIVEPRFRDSTKMQVIKRGAAQSNKILSDFKKNKLSKGGKINCKCGGPIK
jgi:hypothetical protein